MTGIDTKDVPVLRVTDAALAKVLGLRAGEEGGGSLALWVEVSGSSGGAYTYDMYFQATSETRPQDWSDERGGMALVVPADSIAKMRGATLDRQPRSPPGRHGHPEPEPAPGPGRRQPGHGRATGRPHWRRGPASPAGPGTADQPVHCRHGGRADLVAVDDDAAYLRLSGGCAGCGMATVTLSQGIEVAIHDSVPEITRVIDVTDHAAGTNPYYEAAKNASARRR